MEFEKRQSPQILSSTPLSHGTAPPTQAGAGR